MTGELEKMFFRGNELSHLWKTNDLAVLKLQNELVFDANEVKSNPQIW